MFIKFISEVLSLGVGCSNKSSYGVLNFNKLKLQNTS